MFQIGNRKIDVAGLVIIFAGILLTGIGNCAFYTFGVAYLDDNTSHNNSPIMLAMVYCFRLLGPTLGFMLGAFCLRTYVYPSQNVLIEEGDPEWIGAWWLGFPIIGILIFLFAGKLYRLHIYYESKLLHHTKVTWYIYGIQGPQKNYIEFRLPVHKASKCQKKELVDYLLHTTVEKKNQFLPHFGHFSKMQF